MASVSLPDSFASSYHDYSNFPKSLVLKEVYGFHLLKSLYKRLVTRAPELLVSNDETFIPVKDVLKTGEAKKKNLRSDADIKEWLGDDSTVDPLDPTKRIGPLATKEDTSCRFMLVEPPTLDFDQDSFKQ